MATETQTVYTTSIPTHIPHTSAMQKLFTGKPNVLHKRRRNPFQRLVDCVQLGYYRYEVTFGLYVMTWTEKCVANIIVLTVLGLLLWALVFYFPSILYHKLTRLAWLLTGHSDAGVRVPGIIDKHGKYNSPSSVA
ncbi:hypothetical protein N7494_011796 [Penicillium frequentans]|uniref:Uncharacterized protein n=1 Tax=Penicillium frequentans TaxID=3151616 RepID=A0AAD6CKG4_9EURO|nr:hypothetical protein N7494_011796 [Penicillium glabrum]